MKRFFIKVAIIVAILLVLVVPAQAKGADSVWSHKETVECYINYNESTGERETTVISEDVEDGFIRIFDNDRYSTSLRIQTKLRESLGVDKFDTIVIAYGRNAADALSGSYLATITDAPILIIDSIPDEDGYSGYYDDSIRYIKNQINLYLNPKGTVYVLGGSSVISDEFVNSLKTGSITVKRLAGKTRFETNIAILKECTKKGLDDAKSVILCDAYSFADSLSASAVGIPIILIDKSSGHLKQSQIDYLKELSPSKVYIAGGTAAVPKSIATDVKNLLGVTPKRLAGETRYETSLLIAKEFYKNAEVAVFASGQDFPDGLCGGPFAHSVSAPLILVNDNKDTISNVTSYLKSSSIKKIGILGGTSVISVKTQNSLCKAIGLSKKDFSCKIIKSGTYERYQNGEIDYIEYESGANDIYYLLNGYLASVGYNDWDDFLDDDSEYEDIDFDRERGAFDDVDVIYEYLNVGQNAKRLFEYMQYEIGVTGINPDFIFTVVHSGGIFGNFSTGIRYIPYEKVK